MVRDWARPSQIAHVLRGKGSTLIDLKRIDEAEEAIQQSLDLDPNSNTGRNELEYVVQLRRASKEERPQVGKGDIDKNYGGLLMKLTESGELPGLDMGPDEAIGKCVGGKAIRLRRGSNQVAVALIGTKRIILMGDKVLPRDLLPRLELDSFISETLRKELCQSYSPEDLEKLIAEHLPSEPAPPSSSTSLPITPRSAPPSTGSPSTIGRPELRAERSHTH